MKNKKLSIVEREKKLEIHANSMPKKQGKVTVDAATSPQLGLLKFYAFLLNAIKVLFTILLLLFCYNNMKDKTPKRKAVHPKIIIKIGPNSRSKSTHRIEKESSSEITKEQNHSIFGRCNN